MKMRERERERKMKERRYVCVPSFPPSKGWEVKNSNEKKSKEKKMQNLKER